MTEPTIRDLVLKYCKKRRSPFVPMKNNELAYFNGTKEAIRAHPIVKSGDADCKVSAE